MSNNFSRNAYIYQQLVVNNNLMVRKSNISTLPFSTAREITTLVENRRVFTLNNLELNVYETYEESRSVPLTFSDVVIVNMIKGKKIMYLDDAPGFEYLPGETLVLPKNKRMQIDFPEAKIYSPTQCTALTIAKEKIDGVVQYLNDFYPGDTKFQSWGFQWDKFHFDNDSDIAHLSDKLFKIVMSKDVYKDVLADLALKELLIRIMQTQNLLSLTTPSDTKRSPFSSLKAFIQSNISANMTVHLLCEQVNMSKSRLFRDFKREFGITPMEFVIRERISLAKNMLKQKISIKECCYAVGFNDVNYFIRLFRRREGVTPGVYQEKHVSCC